MRSRYWSSDVCSSDLGQPAASAAAVSPPATEKASGKLEAPNTATGPIGRCRRRRSGRGSGWRSGSALSRSEEHTSELQSLMRISYAVFCLKKKKKNKNSSNRQETDNPKQSKTCKN